MYILRYTHFSKLCVIVKIQPFLITENLLQVKNISEANVSELLENLEEMFLVPNSIQFNSLFVKNT